MSEDENIIEKLIDEGGPALEGESTNGVEEVVKPTPTPVVVVTPETKPEVVPDFNNGPERKTVTEKTDKRGGICKDDDVHLAERVVTTEGKKIKEVFRLATYNGGLYDPGGPYSNYQKEKQLSRHMKFKEVSKEVYGDYIQYLVKRSRNLYTKANRSFLND